METLLLDIKYILVTLRFHSAAKLGWLSQYLRRPGAFSRIRSLQLGVMRGLMLVTRRICYLGIDSVVF